MNERHRERPWTVYVLVAGAIAGAVWTLITGDGNLGIEILWFAVSVLFAAALWKGITWVFILAFGAAVCARCPSPSRRSRGSLRTKRPW